MKLSYHVAGQALALVLQYANQVSTIVPVKAQPYIALLIGMSQAGLAFIAHFSPVPGGTSGSNQN